MRRIFLWMVLITPISSLAAMYDNEYQACNNNSTVGIVDCVAGLTKQWDKRLNAAYKKLMGYESPQQVSLKTAQRLWIKYRDANCNYYAAGEGTISRIEAAECMRSMTKDRTCELQAQSEQETGPGPECQ
ncbi:MAG: DUF1311 domain-containing protein [Burkholderiaceae bacterium]|nr:DUF1311 domain-containing protein [Burkholderiaceae bacterium]